MSALKDASLLRPGSEEPHLNVNNRLAKKAYTVIFELSIQWAGSVMRCDLKFIDSMLLGDKLNLA